MLDITLEVKLRGINNILLPFKGLKSKYKSSKKVSEEALVFSKLTLVF